MNTSENNSSSLHPVFPNLNGLRFAGALAVIFYHCYTLNREIWGSFYREYWFQKAWIIVSKGHFGVSLFFIMSGFLITYLLLHERKTNGKIRPLNYLVRRFLRVWPLYFLIVIFGFFVFPRLPYGIETVHELWLFLLFLSNFSEIYVGARDGVNFLTATWTVSVEEQFYLAWAVLFGLLTFRKTAFYVVILISIIAGSLVFRFLHLENHRVLDNHTLSVMSDLATGGLIGLWAYPGMARKAIENLPRLVIIGIYGVGMAMILWEDSIFKGVFFVFERFIPGIFLAFIILEQIYAKHSFFKIDRIPGFFQSGKLTYGLYLFHCIFIYYWAIFFRNHQLTEHLYHYLLFVLAVLVSTYAAAWLSFHYFEQPILKLKRYFR